MSGHSKWATTKHKKAAIDAKRGKLFAKLIKNIEVAARTGGGDPAGTPPSTTPSRRRRRARSPTTTSTAPSSAAARGRRRGLADHHVRGLRARRCRPASSSASPTTATERRRRCRTALTRNGGQLADPGSVAYIFDRKGVVIVLKGEKSEDDILEVVLDAGAEEVNDLGDLRDHLRSH